MVGSEEGFVNFELQSTISFYITFLCYLLRLSSLLRMSWRLSHLFKNLDMLPGGCSSCQEFSRSLLSGLLAVIFFNCLAFAGPMVFFEGSPSKSANRNAAVELKLIPRAITQSTPTIVYSHLLTVSRHSAFSLHQLQILMFEGSISSNLASKCAKGTITLRTTLGNSYQHVALPYS